MIHVRLAISDSPFQTDLVFTGDIENEDGQRFFIKVPFDLTTSILHVPELLRKIAIGAEAEIERYFGKEHNAPL